MNQQSDPERLLKDILSEGLSGEFRQALLGESLRLARQRRRVGHARRAAMALAVLAVFAGLLWRILPTSPVTAEKAQTTTPLVRNSALPPTQLVSTRRLAGGEIVTSQPLPAEKLLTTMSATLFLSPTAADGQIRFIDDSELLALVGSKPVALMRRGPHAAELVFINRADRELFIGQ